VLLAGNAPGRSGPALRPVGQPGERLARRGKLTSPFSPETQAEAAAQAERTLAARKVEGAPSPAASPRPSPAFAAIEVEAPPPGSVGSVSIEARGVMVRLDGDIDTPRIAEIASALRALR
jgi:hypothetical protein